MTARTDATRTNDTHPATVETRSVETRPSRGDRQLTSARCGWRLTVAAAFAVSLMAAALLVFYGAGEDGLRSVIRNTARTSFVLFLAGFAGPALATLRPARATRRLAALQSQLFAAFAASHLLHAAAIFTLAWQTGGASLEDRGAAVVAGGGFVYLSILASAAPAHARAARWLAARPKLNGARTVGLYLVWLTFLDSYGGRAVRSIFYAPFALALLAALSLRWIAALKRRRRPRCEASNAACYHQL